MTEIELRKEIIRVLEESYETDYVFNGEDEVPMKYFDKSDAADNLVNYIREICPTLFCSTRGRRRDSK